MRQHNSLNVGAASSRLARAYRDALLAGESQRAEQIVRDLLTLGLDPAEMYQQVFAPALESVGTLWQQGVITVAEEHLATAITERMMGLVRPLFRPEGGDRPDDPRPVLLLACAPGEQHRVGPQMVTDVFTRGGWDVLYLGADCPATDLLKLAASRRPDVIAFSVTIDRHLTAVREVIQRLHEAPAPRGIPVLVGGAPFSEDPTLGEEIGADMVARSPLEALALADALLESAETAQDVAGRAVPSAADPAALPAALWQPGVTLPAPPTGFTKDAELTPATPRPTVPATGGDPAELVSAAIVFVLDGQGRIRWANEAALTLAGDDAAPAIGRAFAGLTDNYSREKVMRLLARVGGGETVVDFEINHVVPHHNAPIVLVSYSAFCGPDGTVTLVGRDLGKRIDAVSRLAETNQRLEGMLSELVQERSRLEAQAAAFSDVRRRLEHQWRNERRIAVALQKSFLGDVPNYLPGVEVAYRYHAAQADAHVGGDFYDVSAVDEDHVAVVVADVSGKGLRAALATVMVKYTMRAYAAEDPTPSRVLTRFNRFICEHGDLDGFITVFYGLLNVRTGELRWGSAGHEPSLIVRPQGEGRAPVFEMLEETALVAGAMPDTEYEDFTTHLGPGDLLVLYTDGIIDARQRTGEPGDGRLLGFAVMEAYLRERFESGAAPDAEQVAGGLYGRVTALCGGRLDDDATLLVVRRPAPEE